MLKCSVQHEVRLIHVITRLVDQNNTYIPYNIIYQTKRN